jgi:23S rRNA pseudouridine1911/1915/1917 synthase
MSELSSRILYRDPDCVVVNKIAGEAVEGAGEGMIDLPRLLAALVDAENASALPAAMPAALPMPVAVHRLDVPVSGCVVFARSEPVLRALNAAFSSGATQSSGVQKIYWAIVEMPRNDITLPDSEPVELIHWIQFDPRKNKSIAHNEPGPNRKKAVMRCRLAGRGTHYLFLEIELITGRHHQIRAQLARMGLHVKGDLKYGAKRSEPNGGIRLHARSLSFPGQNGRRITVQADPPVRDNLWQSFIDSAKNATAEQSSCGPAPPSLPQENAGTG